MEKQTLSELREIDYEKEAHIGEMQRPICKMV